jgi:hypothetical protein
VIGIFLCVEDGVEVYPRQGKSIFPHQKYRLPVWVVGIFLCMEDGVEVYPPKEEIHLPPPKIPITLLGDWYFSLRQNRQVSKETCRFYFSPLPSRPALSFRNLPIQGIGNREYA